MKAENPKTGNTAEAGRAQRPHIWIVETWGNFGGKMRWGFHSLARPASTKESARDVMAKCRHEFPRYKFRVAKYVPQIPKVGKP